MSDTYQHIAEQPEFTYAFERTVGIEGGYVNDSDDPGGETKYGISRKSYPRLNIKELTLSDAKEIYAIDFWVRMRLGLIISKHVAAELFDTGVNCGQKTAVYLAQSALGFLGHELVYDGIMGPQTAGILNGESARSNRHHLALLLAMNGEQYGYYRSLPPECPVLRKYAAGWAMRLIVPCELVEG